MLDDADFERLGLLITASVKQQIDVALTERVPDIVRAVVRDEVRTIVDERIDALEKRLTPRIAAFDQEMTTIKEHVAIIEGDMLDVKNRLTSIDQRLSVMEGRMDNSIKQMAEMRAVVDGLSTKLRDVATQMKMLNENIRQAYGMTLEHDERLESLETLMRRFASQQPPAPQS